MEGVNSSNGMNEDRENPSGGLIDQKSAFLKSFKLEIEGKNELERVSFYDNLINSTEISPFIRGDLEKSMTYSSDELMITKNKEKYPGLKLDSISINDLKSNFSSDIISLQRERLLLKTIIFNDYEISTKQYKSEVVPKINKLTKTEIFEIKNSKKIREDFLVSLLKEKMPVEKSKLNFFKEIPGLKEKILNENLENREELESIIRRLGAINRGDTLTSMEKGYLSDLFSSNFLEISFKKQILEEFLPVISFKEAIEIGIISETKEKEEKEKIIKEVFSDSEIRSIGIDILIGNLKNESIFLETATILSDINVIKISENKELSYRVADNYTGYFNLIVEKDIEKLKEEGPQSFEELKEGLNSINKEGRFTNINEKFIEGSIMELKKQTEDGTWEINYVKILKTNNDSKDLTLLSIGKGKNIYLKKQGEGGINSYLTFFENFKKSNTKITFFTENDIKEKIKSPIDDLKGGDLATLSVDEVSNLSSEDKELYKNHYRKKLENDLGILEEELGYTEGDTDENPLLSARIKNIKENLGNLDNLDNAKLSNFINFQKLLTELDNIDSEGKNIGLEKGTILKAKKEGTFEIVGINEDDQTIEVLSRINGVANIERGIGYEEFFQACKKHEIKRSKKIENFTDFLNLAKKENEDKWRGYEFENNTLIAKSVEYGGEEGDQEVEYFISDKENEIIKIDNISGGNITVQFGERKNEGNLDKKDKNYKKDGEGEVLFLDSTKYTFSLDEFNELISDEKYDYRPEWQTGKDKKSKVPEAIQNKLEGSFMTRLFGRTSVNELLAGGKMFFEGMEESLKRGNELHAAKVALAMGKYLPEEMRADMQIKVERYESEEMDKALDALGKVDSSVAVNRIRGWLLNKDTSESKKEAGLMFLVSKYGVLYAKGMGDDKGTFLWYEAFGGRINDKLFLEKKEKAAKSGLPFTEEDLMYSLLNDQCKKNKYFPHIKRRGRLYKDYDGKIGQGITDELAKGSKEAIAMRNFSDRNEAAIGEFKGGEFNNGIGKYKEAVNRGSSIDELNELPFCILFSGTGYLLQQEQLNEFKSFAESKFGGLLFTRFLGETDGMEIFNDTVLKLSKDFEESDSENFSGMYNEAKEIFDNQLDSSKTIGSKIEKAQLFWGKYGKALTRTMLRLNNQDSKFIKTDKLLLQKEKEYSNYSKTLDGYVEWAVFSDEETMNAHFGNQGISGLSYRVFDEIGGLSADARFRKNEAAEKILNEIFGEIENTVKYSYANDDNENRRIKMLNLERQLSFLFSYVKKNSGQSKTMENMKEGSSYWGKFKDLGISSYINELEGSKYLIENLINLDTPEVKKFIRGVAEGIIDGNISGNTSNFSNSFTEIITDIQDATNDTLEYKKVA